jgi:DNA polymerase-3 subunit gamma/tau
MSLYRRHRPQTFDEVVGQAHIVRTLRNAVEQGKVHHAYLFVGSRGTGKTSIAKILALSLNCVRGPTLEPCGECESCRAIAASTSLDVIEMDAASNNSVEDIRDLREKVGFAPALGRSKVYILDEAHMLSTSAWNAFLKTLEEPPPSTIFVLATTEAHKVPATIIDRCHRFDFQRPSLGEIVTVLSRIAEAEEIEADQRALAMIARSAAGSFRDAIGTLDQLVTYGGKKVELEQVLEVLGAADAGLIFETTEALIAHDPAAALGRVAELAESGRDPVQFMRDLVAHLRQLVVVQTIGEAPDSFSVTADDPERLADQAGRMTQAEAVRAIDLTSAALAAVKEGSDPRLQLELSLLKAARPQADASIEAVLARLEQLERAGGSGPGAGPGADDGVRARARGAERKAAPSSAETERPPAPKGSSDAEADDAGADSADVASEEPSPEPAPEAGPQEAAPKSAPGRGVEEIKALWPAVLERVRSIEGGAMLAALLAEAQPTALEQNRLTLAYPPSAAFSKRKVEHPVNRDRVSEALALIAGQTLVLEFELSDEASVPSSGRPESVLSEEEVIERIKEVFDAEDLSSEEDATEKEAQESV